MFSQCRKFKWFFKRFFKRFFSQLNWHPGLTLCVSVPPGAGGGINLEPHNFDGPCTIHSAPHMSSAPLSSIERSTRISQWRRRWKVRVSTSTVCGCLSPARRSPSIRASHPSLVPPSFLALDFEACLPDAIRPIRSALLSAHYPTHYQKTHDNVEPLTMFGKQTLDMHI